MKPQTPDNEVAKGPWECFSDPCYYDMARLRRKDGPKDFNTGFHLNTLREAQELRDILNSYEAQLAPAPEEPVTQDESSNAVRYADYILNHYDRNSKKDKLCLAKDLLRHGWNNGQANAPAPDGKTCEGLTDPEARKRYATLATAPEEPKACCTSKDGPNGCLCGKSWPSEPATEWRELGEDEVIQEGDEEPKDGGGWMPVLQCYVGKKAKGLVYPVRTRRPLPTIKESLSVEAAPEWRVLGRDEVICEGDEYKCLGVWRRDTDLIGMTVKNAGGTFRTRRPLPKQEGYKVGSDWCEPAPECPNCKNNTMVWQEKDFYNHWVCHRAGCGKPVGKPKPKEELPLEKEISYLEINVSRSADIHTHVVIVDCLRYLRDEIAKLKEAR